MPAISPAQARVADPVLSSVAQGFVLQEMVGFSLFPVVPVASAGGRIVQFDRSDFMLYNTKRAPGQNTPRVQFGHSGAPYALVDDRLEGLVPKETARLAALPGINMAARAINGVQRIMLLGLENSQAALARATGTYAASNRITLSGTSQFSDYANSDPASVFATGREAVRTAVGLYPNTCVMGALVFSKLRDHPKVVEKFKYTSSASITEAMLAQYLGFDELKVGKAVYANDAGTSMVDIWGRDVVLAYTPQASLRDMGAPTFGYTYQLEDTPLVEEPYEDKNRNSYVYPVSRCEAPVVAAQGAGYLIKDAVA